MFEKPLNSLPSDEYLSHDELKDLYGILKSQADSILDHSRSAVSTLTETQINDPDTLDLAVSESNRDFTLRFADRDRKLLQKIRHALHRMEEGEYGVCESCGEPISYARLKARPVATMCIDCKTEAEQVEHPRRRSF
ncbi:MAG: RNA polymerase-binding protein DksA [Deltaproteobacteria bacterium]|nr:RNA polymerase-binding protein DksA [Deltaproteobacteria bacterium]